MACLLCLPCFFALCPSTRSLSSPVCFLIGAPVMYFTSNTVMYCTNYTSSQRCQTLRSLVILFSKCWAWSSGVPNSAKPSHLESHCQQLHTNQGKTCFNIFPFCIFLFDSLIIWRCITLVILLMNESRVLQGCGARLDRLVTPTDRGKGGWKPSLRRQLAKSPDSCILHQVVPFGCITTSKFSNSIPIAGE